MQFLALTQRLIDRFPPESWTPDLLEAEAQRVRQLYTSGLIRSISRRGDMPGAAILLEAASEEEVRAALATLPLAELGMISIALVTQLHPYAGFAPR
jgi:muconolactone delta-isomerase